MDEQEQPVDKSADIFGIGKLAKAIPPEAYVKTTEVLLSTFTKIVSPITETTTGLGNYIKQKFDNMVDAEKAVATFTIQNAVNKAEKKAKRLNTKLINPKHAKSFVTSIEESSKETDPLLHEMWENILANQLLESDFHPHFVKILSHFSSEEANLLLSLNERKDIGEDISIYYAYSADSFEYYITKCNSIDLNPWTYSCNLLLEFGFADVVATTLDNFKKEDKVTVLYLTKSGMEFLKSVSA